MASRQPGPREIAAVLVGCTGFSPLSHRLPRQIRPRCGARCRGSLPFDAEPTGLGPRWTAFVAFLAVRTKDSVRDIAALVHDVFGVPMATGSIIACE